MASDSDSETEDWDDIVAYDTETSRYIMVANQEPCQVHNHRRTNKHHHCMNDTRDTARLNG